MQSFTHSSETANVTFTLPRKVGAARFCNTQTFSCKQSSRLVPYSLDMSAYAKCTLSPAPKLHFKHLTLSSFTPPRRLLSGFKKISNHLAAPLYTKNLMKGAVYKSIILPQRPIVTQLFALSHISQKSRTSLRRCAPNCRQPAYCHHSVGPSSLKKIVEAHSRHKNFQ